MWYRSAQSQNSAIDTLIRISWHDPVGRFCISMTPRFAPISVCFLPDPNHRHTLTGLGFQSAKPVKLCVLATSKDSNGPDPVDKNSGST